MTAPARTSILAAVTGGLACGKSEVGRILERHGVRTWDADDAARAVTAIGSPALENIARSFGDRMLDPAGGLNRRHLARLVFSDSAARARLNAIVHPPVMERCRAWCAVQRAEGRQAAALIPLLFETGMDAGDWDAVICVTDREERVRERLYARGLSPQEAGEWMAAQWPRDEKERHAEYVIRNHADLNELEQRTLAVWRRIVEKGRVHHA